MAISNIVRTIHRLAPAALLTLLAVALASPAASVSAAAPENSPATAPAPGTTETAGKPAATAPAAQPEKLEITITGVEGIVQVRTAENQPWQIAKVGMKLDQGAEFRTGPRSAVRFVIPPDQTITLDRLGTLKILQAIQDATKVKTDLGMKYGRTRYDIEGSGVEHQSQILGPGSTLAIRGTKVSLYDQPPFEPEVRSLTGRAIYVNTKKNRIPFGAKGQKAAVTGGEHGAAQHEVAKTLLTPVSLADSDDQQRLFLLHQREEAQLGSIINTATDFAVALLGMPKVSDVQTDLARDATKLGNLVFDLLWTGNADVNLIVVTPNHQTLASSPFETTAGGNLKVLTGALPRLANGGRIDPGDYDSFHNNQPLSAGRETAYWAAGTTFPTGSYSVSANLTAGTGTDSLTLNVYKKNAAGTVSLLDTFSGDISSSSPTYKFPKIPITH